MSSCRLLQVLVFGFMALAGQAAATSVVPIAVYGNIATSDPHSCASASLFDPTSINPLLGWTRCHELKRHVDAGGAPITIAAFDPDALRTMHVTVEVNAWCVYGEYGDLHPVVSTRTQTNARGDFKLLLPAFDCPAKDTADSVIVQASALLQYVARDAQGNDIGTIRAVWDQARGESVYSSILPRDAVLYSNVWGDYVVPRFLLARDSLPLPLSNSSRERDLGPIVFFGGAAPYYYGWLRGALSAWETVVVLHEQLRSALAVDGHDWMYPAMFVTNPAFACARCYTLSFDLPFSGGMGAPGGFDTQQPTISPTLLEYETLVSVGLPAHEFGHSMHGTIAPHSFGRVDWRMNLGQGPAGGLFASHSTYAEPNTLQQQIMMSALAEGFGNTMGTYFTVGCLTPDRFWGNPDPRQNFWNVGQYAYCDANDGWCPYRAFRYQMSQRGIAENSQTWNDRMESLAMLAEKAAGAGAIVVTSSNEGKVRNFMCDLLDGDTDVSFAAGQIAGQSYVPDFMWHVAERLDGREPPIALATYSDDPEPETVQISLGTLLEAMDGFVPDLFTVPAVYPPGIWTTPTIIDGANGPYNDTDISYNGPFSSQGLGMYLVNSGVITRRQLNSILRANRMEEVP